MSLSFYLRSIDVAELSVMAALPPDFSGDSPARIILLLEEVRLINLLRTDGLGRRVGNHDLLTADQGFI